MSQITYRSYGTESDTKTQAPEEVIERVVSLLFDTFKDSSEFKSCTEVEIFHRMLQGEIRAAIEGGAIVTATDQSDSSLAGTAIFLTPQGSEAATASMRRINFENALKSTRKVNKLRFPGVREEEGELQRNVTAWSNQTRNYNSCGWMAVAPDLRGQGVGTELLTHIKRLSAETGPSGAMMWLDATQDERVVKFYQRNGFVAQGALVYRNVDWSYETKTCMTFQSPTGTGYPPNV